MKLDFFPIENVFRKTAKTKNFSFSELIMNEVSRNLRNIFCSFIHHSSSSSSFIIINFASVQVSYLGRWHLKKLRENFISHFSYSETFYVEQYPTKISTHIQKQTMHFFLLKVNKQLTMVSFGFCINWRGCYVCIPWL